VVSARTAFTTLFRQPGWVKTILLGTLFIIVPVVGPIILQGYGARVLLHVALDREGPIPPLRKPGELLREGMNSFIAFMLWALPINLIYYAFIALAMILFGIVVALMGPESRSLGLAIGGIQAGLLFVVGLVVVIVLGRHALAADTLVEVTGKLHHAWRLGDIRSYLGVLGWEGRLAFLRLILGNAVSVAAGTLLCGLGVCFAPFVMMYAQAHLQGQLYRRYIELGGSPFHPVDGNDPGTTS
jgi:hypothetical protein